MIYHTNKSPTSTSFVVSNSNNDIESAAIKCNRWALKKLGRVQKIQQVQQSHHTHESLQPTTTNTRTSSHIHNIDYHTRCNSPYICVYRNNTETSRSYLLENIPSIEYTSSNSKTIPASKFFPIPIQVLRNKSQTSDIPQKSLRIKELENKVKRLRRENLNLREHIKTFQKNEDNLSNKVI